MNNLLKSLFIGLYAPYVILVAALSARELAGNLDLASLGVLLAHAPMALFFARVLVFRNQARSHPWPPWVSAITVTGATMSLTALVTADKNAAIPGLTGAATYGL